jgi:hypothetical protein
MTWSFGQRAFIPSERLERETSRVLGLDVAVKPGDTGAERLDGDSGCDGDKRNQQRVLDHRLPILVRYRRQAVS